MLHQLLKRKSKVNSLSLLYWMIVLVLTLPLVACGQSPVLNHLDAGSPQRQNQELSQNPPATCDFQFVTLQLCGHIQWMAEPQIGDDSPFALSFIRLSDEAASELPGNLRVQLWMPSMGHGSAPVKISKTGVGSFEIRNVQFLMAGEWEIRFSVIDTAGKRLDSAQMGMNL